LNLTLIVLGTLSFAFLFWMSLLESSVSKMSQVSLRIMLERGTDRDMGLLKDIVRDRARFLLPLQLTIHIVTIVAAIMMVKFFIDLQIAFAVAWAIVLSVLFIGMLRELIVQRMTQNNPEQYVIRLLPLWKKIYRFLEIFSSPVLWFLPAREDRLGEGNPRNGEETSEEQIQAYLDVGEEAGILEEHETELIQSALEFKGTLVREIMTPRSQIVSISETATVVQLAQLIADRKISRIPVYRGTSDHIIGVVYVRNLVSCLSRGRGSDAITQLIKDVWFVPETKHVRELLKEMQRESQHLALVVSEYGSVSGLVSIEDLLEEIVGEIYDEDEPHHVSLVKIKDGSYNVRGEMELSHLEEELDIDLGQNDATTISGLVVGHLGCVPSVGQEIKINGLVVTIMEADQKRIKLMQIRILAL